MADELSLTDAERELILQRRAEQERAAVALAERRAILDIASRYEAWLQDNGRGSTFSTFVDEFGYDDIGAGDVFSRVEAIRAAAGEKLSKAYS